MWPAIATLGAGALSFLGQRHANTAMQQSIRDQMSFQERMRSSQYQASMADMRAAGLNPILAYKQGGAGTPSGASGTPQNEFASAVAIRQDMANIAFTKAQTALTLANARSVEAGLPKKELVGEGYSTARHIWEDVKAGWKGEFQPKNVKIDEDRYF